MYQRAFWLEISDPNSYAPLVYPLHGGNFSSDIVGGYNSAEIPIVISTKQKAVMARKLFSKNAKIFSPFGDVVYEGRIERITNNSVGLTLSAMGHYGEAKDLTSGLIYPDTTPTSISDIILDHISLVPGWVNTGVFVTVTTTDITPLDFSGEAKIMDAIEKVLTFGSDDTVPRKLYFQIWNDKIPHLIVEPSLTSYKYSIDLDYAQFGGNLVETSLSRENLFNKIQVLFDDPAVDGQEFTNWYEDLASQSAYGIREGTINLGQTLQAMADTVAELAVNRFRNPEQTLSLSVPEVYCSMSNYTKPGHYIRAGDVVLLTGTPADLFYEDYNPGRATAIVTHASYDIGSKSLSLSFGTRSPSFELLLAGLGYSGVSVT